MIRCIDSLVARPLLTPRIERDVIAGLFGVFDSRRGRFLVHLIDCGSHKIVEFDDQMHYWVRVLRKMHGQRLSCEVVGASVVFARQLPSGRWQTVFTTDFAPDHVVYD
jgi:hypothetical protein